MTEHSDDRLPAHWREEARRRARGKPSGTTPAAFPAFSDEALALTFADQYADRLRYVAGWGRWMDWEGDRWRVDGTLLAFDRARQICRDAASKICKEKKEKAAAAIASAKTVAAIERLARADRRIAATVDQWDVHPWSLATPDGTVNLQTGEIRPASPEDYISKCTAATPDPNCPTPVWLRFLDDITDGDEDLVGFLRRMVGYSLTGSTVEHALFFLYGTGANGKSTFLNTLTGCMGDYHRPAPIETFTASNTTGHPTDLAGLRGARLVTSLETEEGRRWAEAKIKMLTGGDPIAARFMRQDFFEFIPCFKLIIAGNHKPGLRSVDEAIRRRFHLVPFQVTIPPEQRDERLADQLRDEWQGILAWAIDGCLEWQERGLAPPAVVRDATEAYLEGEDAMTAWREEASELKLDGWESSTSLFLSWKAWAERSGELPGSLKKFSQRLEDRGAAINVQRARNSSGVRGFRGLKLKSPIGREDQLDGI